MPGKVLDGINVTGAASVGSDLSVSGKISTSSFKMTSAASAGKFMTCDSEGNGVWGTVDQEWGMKFAQNSVNTETTLVKAGTEAVVMLTAAGGVTLPAIDDDVQGRMYVIVNTHSAPNPVTPNAANKIDGGVAGAGISLPATDGKITLVAGTAAQGWFTI